MLKIGKKKRKKNRQGKQYKTLENPNPIVTEMKTPNENLNSFYIGRRQNEYSYYQQKLSQKLEKIELINIKKHQKLKLRQNADEARAKMNLRKSEEKKVEEKPKEEISTQITEEQKPVEEIKVEEKEGSYKRKDYTLLQTKNEGLNRNKLKKDLDEGRRNT